MKHACSCLSFLSVLAFALLATASAKDKELAFSAVPPAVQATIQKTVDAGATLEKVEMEDASGGTQYGAKIIDKNGQCWEIILTADGKVVKTTQKKAKK